MKHTAVFPKLLGTFTAQTLAARYDADPSAADGDASTLPTFHSNRFRTAPKYTDLPAAADIAFCVAAYAYGMPEDRISVALEDDYLSRDPSPAKRASYIRRTMTKARDWANR
jgi:hypothetical protein